MKGFLVINLLLISSQVVFLIHAASVEYNATDIPPKKDQETASNSSNSSSSSDDDWWTVSVPNVFTYFSRAYDGMASMFSRGAASQADLEKEKNLLELSESSKYPPNYNETKVTFLEINGKHYVKKVTVYKKTDNESFVSFELIGN